MATRGQQKKSNATLSKAELTKLEKEAEKRSEARKESNRRGRSSAIKNREAGNAGLSSKRLNRMEAEAERKSEDRKRAESRKKQPMTDAEKRMIRRIADNQNQTAQNKGDAKLRTEKRGAGSSTRGPQKPAPKGVLSSVTDATKRVASRVGRGAKALTGAGALLTAEELGGGKDTMKGIENRRNEFVDKYKRGRGDGAAEVRARQAEKKPSEPKATSTSTTGDNEPRSIAEAKRMGKDYFIDKSGNKKAAVTAEELKASGMSLRDYLNKQKGKKRMAKGGMVKSNCGASMPPAQKSSKGNK